MLNDCPGDKRSGDVWRREIQFRFSRRDVAKLKRKTSSIAGSTTVVSSRLFVNQKLSSQISVGELNAPFQDSVVAFSYQPKPFSIELISIMIGFHKDVSNPDENFNSRRNFFNQNFPFTQNMFICIFNTPSIRMHVDLFVKVSATMDELGTEKVSSIGNATS